ncbi:hypothetical protein NZ35_13640 [Pseudomonas chlororaphis]|uniref:DUF2357 domain-containing protein n=1 Tax=Pseudomonas chlororaphis TaxID=587753 RepID=A0A0A6DDG9_9PSED|nr:hypothetical protein NZ35_13640 [Pseudomonas chlororaphis]
MLSIEIISGERKGEILVLEELSTLSSRVLAIREDEALRFSVKLDEFYENLNLVLHEIETPHTHHYQMEGGWVYEWLPREIYGRKESFFHNFYGLAELQLVAREQSANASDLRYALFIEFHPLEVFAKKINAERVDRMLGFLARHDGRDLASAIRVTRIRAGHKAGGKTETFLLERIENNIIFLKNILPAIFAAPLSRLQQSTRLVVPNNETLIDESSLRWISENPDSLYKTYSVDDSVIHYQGEYFSTSKLLESKASNSTDIYENQILHGFIYSIIAAIGKIRARLLSPNAKGQSSGWSFNGYVSLFTQINKFSCVINQNKVDKCNRLMAEMSSMYAMLKRKIPVSRPSLELPRYTQKSKFNLLYRQVFARSIAWRRYGAPDWSFQDELFSIQSIPRLFEYYLLCVVKRHLQENFNDDLSLNDESEGVDVFSYGGINSSVDLMYEPDIWTVGHASAVGQELVNTEGWTVYHGRGDTKISKRGSFGSRANRCPDIVIKITSQDESAKYIIIDAKYTDSSRAYLNYLPELTMKYVHGIHKQGASINPTVALIIVNPSEEPSTRHFHQYDYSIYGKHSVVPALLVSSIDVSAAHEPESNFRKDLARVMEINL